MVQVAEELDLGLPLPLMLDREPELALVLAWALALAERWPAGRRWRALDSSVRQIRPSGQSRRTVEDADEDEDGDEAEAEAENVEARTEVAAEVVKLVAARLGLELGKRVPQAQCRPRGCSWG